MPIKKTQPVKITSNGSEGIDVYTSVSNHMNFFLSSFGVLYSIPEFEEELIDKVVQKVKMDLPETEEKDIEDAIQLYNMIEIPMRCDGPTYTCDYDTVYKPYMSNAIEHLKSILQPEQRTKKWYDFRHQMITASDIGKATMSDHSRAQLVKEKSNPMDSRRYSGRVNVNSPLHWGQKYEPLSVMVYEERFSTKIGDFGCIQHPKYSFIGASPDGINVCPGSKRFGRMLEIKNVFNREITGIPKEEYWIQTQIQMEVCDLDLCDFLETRFIEYPDEAAFLQDGSSFGYTEDGKRKGAILHFMNDGIPLYIYAPLSIKTLEDYNEWEKEQVCKFDSSYSWIQTIYWKLDTFSCVLIRRNRLWFEKALPLIESTWTKIVEARKENEQKEPCDKPTTNKSKYRPKETIHVIKLNI